MKATVHLRSVSCVSVQPFRCQHDHSLPCKPPLAMRHIVEVFVSRKHAVVDPWAAVRSS